MKITSYEDKMKKHKENHDYQRDAIKTAMNDKLNRIPELSELRAVEDEA